MSPALSRWVCLGVGVCALSATFQASPPHSFPDGRLWSRRVPTGPRPHCQDTVRARTPVRQVSLVLTRHGLRPTTASASPATPRGRWQHPPRPPDDGEGQSLVQGHMASKGPGDAITKQGLVRGGGVTRELGRGPAVEKEDLPSPQLSGGYLGICRSLCSPRPRHLDSAGHCQGHPQG